MLCKKISRLTSRLSILPICLSAMISDWQTGPIMMIVGTLLGYSLMQPSTRHQRALLCQDNWAQIHQACKELTCGRVQK